MVTLHKILADVHGFLKIWTKDIKNLCLCQCQVKYYFLSILVISKVAQVGNNVLVVFERKLVLYVLGVCFHCVTKHFLLFLILQITIYCIVFLQIWYNDIVNNGIIQVLSTEIVVSLCIENLHDTILYF